MSKTYLSAVVLLLAEILPIFGLNIGSDKLTEIVQAIIILVTGSIILVQRYKKGDITLVGSKK